jgi:hypothetical protein
MLKYRILHIPTGSWVSIKVREPYSFRYTYPPFQFRFKWSANRALAKFLADKTYMYNSYGQLEVFTINEFCVVSVNADLHIRGDN